MENIGPIPIIICFSIYRYVRLQFFSWYRLWWYNSICRADLLRRYAWFLLWHIGFPSYRRSVS